MISDAETSSTRPYLIRAIYEWCTDNGLTPHVAVAVDGSVQVPREFVRDNEIVLNVSLEATSALKLGNEFIEFKARFGGVPREIMVPIERVMAIYAKEGGQGMSFPLVVAKVGSLVDSQVKAATSVLDVALLNASDVKPSTLASVKNDVRDEGSSEAPFEPPPRRSRVKLKRVK